MVRTFDPHLPAFAKQDFTYDGKQYAAGAEFPHHALGVHWMSLRGLWMAHLIETHVRPASVDDADLERLTAPRAAPPARAANRR
ncbi:MAG TPA: hypothetical protein VFQ42_22360 [Mycobacterium sp.]|nr:hypothetical protein [Mycobacterium sp.]